MPDPEHIQKSSDTVHAELTSALQERILVLDGAYGTLLQDLNLVEEDYRGDRLAGHTVPLKGNYDVLSLTQPEISGLALEPGFLTPVPDNE